MIQAGILLLAVGSLSIAQDERDEDLTQLPGEADRFYRLGEWEKAERAMRERLAQEASPSHLKGLVNVLYRARKYDACGAECERLAGTKERADCAFALALKGAAAWKKGDSEGARVWCAQALALADAHGTNAYPAVREEVRKILVWLTWKRRVGKNVLMYHAPETIVSEELCAHLERSLEVAAEGMKARPPDAVEYFLFRDQREADEVLGMPLSYAVPRERVVYALLNAPHAHLMAHVVGFFAASQAGQERPRNAMLVEGAAHVFGLEPLWEQRLREIPRALLERKELPSLREVLERRDGGADLAAIGGSLVQWLITEYGRPAFLRLWALFNEEGSHVWETVYGQTLEKLDEAWRTALKK